MIYELAQLKVSRCAQSPLGDQIALGPALDGKRNARFAEKVSLSVGDIFRIGLRVGQHERGRRDVANIVAEATILAQKLHVGVVPGERAIASRAGHQEARVLHIFDASNAVYAGLTSERSETDTVTTDLLYSVASEMS